MRRKKGNGLLGYLMKNDSKKAKARYLQNLVRDRICKLFPKLGPDDIRTSLMRENGADVKLTSLTASTSPSFDLNVFLRFFASTANNFYTRLKLFMK